MKALILNTTAAAAILLASGCDRKSQSQPDAGSGQTSSNEPVPNVADYFPIAPGTRWVYRIEIGETEPLAFTELIRKGTGAEQSTVHMDRFRPVALDKSRKTFILDLQVKRSVEVQRPGGYSLDGAELEILKDELGVFTDTKQAVLAVDRGQQRFMAYQILSVAKDFGDSGDGMVYRYLIFGDKVGARLRVKRESYDALEYMGMETTLPGFPQGKYLHFQRTIQPVAPPKGVDEFGKSEGFRKLNTGFLEDMWYAQGKGLVFLKQTRTGKMAMTWKLDQNTSQNRAGGTADTSAAAKAVATQSQQGEDEGDSIFSLRREPATGQKASSGDRPEYDKPGWDYFSFDSKTKRIGRQFGYTVTHSVSDFLNEDARGRKEYKFAEKAHRIYVVSNSNTNSYIKKGVAITGMKNTGSVPQGDDSSVIAAINTKADRITVFKEEDWGLNVLVRHWQRIMKE